MVDMGNQVFSDMDAWRLNRVMQACPPPAMPLISTDGSTILTTPGQRARAFLREFVAKHTAAIAEPAPSVLPPRDSDAIPPVTQWEIRSALRLLNKAGAADVVGVPPRLLNMLGEASLDMLAKMSNEIVSGTVAVPQGWKDCVFVPLLKTGKPADHVCSYRPVAMTSVLCRLFERVIVERLVSHVRTRLSQHQHGFRRLTSTLDAIAHLLAEPLQMHRTPLSCFRQDMSGATDRANPIILLGLIDLTDAFSKTPHSEVLAAMDRFQVPAYIRHFVKDWLSGRRGKVYHDGTTTNWSALPAGVPQGSVLGPLLFVLVFDDLLCAMDEAIAPLNRRTIDAPVLCTVSAFADDLSLSVTSPQPSLLVPTMQDLCNVVDLWCAAHGLVISLKSQFAVIMHARPNVHLPDVSLGEHVFAVDMTDAPFRLLGVWFDRKLAFVHHTDRVIAAFENRLVGLSRLAQYIRPCFLSSVLQASVQGLLYGTEIWYSTANESCRQRIRGALIEGCRTLLSAVGHCNGSQALAEAGFYPADKMIEDMVIRLAAQRSTVEGRHDILNTIFHPRLVRNQRTLPTIIPSTPPPLALDRVTFRSKPCVPIRKANATIEQQREANDLQRQQALASLPDDSVVIEIWTDGSVKRDDTGDWGGAGVAVWDHSGALVRVEHVAAPLHPCSYSAEYAGALAAPFTANDVVADPAIQSLRPGRHVAALICSDGQSWISNASTGPIRPGVFAPVFWNNIQQILPFVDRVIVCFMFAHCDDPHGDIVDAAADEAQERMRNTLSFTTPWHIDYIRPQLQANTRSFEHAMRSEQTFRRRFTDSAVGLPPPMELSRREAIHIGRLRTGVWPPLGVSTILHDVPPSRCRHCPFLLARGDGLAIEHMFMCPHVPRRPAGMSCSMLWSEDAVTLRAVLAYAFDFAHGFPDPDPPDDDALPLALPPLPPVAPVAPFSVMASL